MQLCKTNKKTVLVISTSPFVSGAERSFFELLDQIKGSFNLVFVLSRFLPETQLPQAGESYRLAFRWLKKTRNPFRIIVYAVNIMLLSLKLCVLIKRFRVDIIYVNSMKALVYMLLPKMLMKCKVVCHLRDNIQMPLLFQFIEKNCDALVSISSHIHQQTGNTHKNHLIYGGIDIHFWTPEINSGNESNSCLTVTDRTRVVSYVAQITQWKNHSDFIHCAHIISKCCKNVKFQVIGGCHSAEDIAYRKELFSLVKQLGLTDCFHFLGNRNDVKQLMATTDVLVHAAIDEPFGRSVAEAMAMEKPVVAYNCGGPKEIVEHDKTGYLVERFNYTQLAEKCLLLLEDQKLCMAMGATGRQRVKEHFSLKQHAREMQKLLQAV